MTYKNRKSLRSLFNTVLIGFCLILGLKFITSSEPISPSAFMLLVDDVEAEDNHLIIFSEDGETHTVKVIEKESGDIYTKTVNWAFAKNNVIEISQNNNVFSSVTLRRIAPTQTDFKVDILDSKGTFKFTLTISTEAVALVDMNLDDITIYE